MCTWSGSRCPSSIRLSFCSASLPNTSPKYFRNSPYNSFRRPFGINTTWYLHSHFEWLKLSYSSIQFLLCVCFAAHAWSFLHGLPYLSNFACLPGRAGGTPISLVVENHDLIFLLGLRDLGFCRWRREAWPCLGGWRLKLFLLDSLGNFGTDSETKRSVDIRHRGWVNWHPGICLICPQQGSRHVGEGATQLRVHFPCAGFCHDLG